MNKKMLQESQDALLRWYETNGRHDLAWRNTNDLYHIYISEIMLQQTQVNRVMEHFYPNFLAKFPTLASLSQTQEEDVLSAWSGLGYYSRARNIHATAKLCTTGELPHTMEELQKLPGIGRYTASAVCAFGLNQAVAVVDTNIARVIKRLFSHAKNDEKAVLKDAESFVNIHMPREHNLALMDLGSLICTPTNPKCDECPLNFTCRAKESPELFTHTKKTEYESLELFLGICIKQGRIALTKSEGRMYKNMLTLPNIEPLEEHYITTFKHSYTKYRLTVKLYKVEELACEKVWLEFDEVKNAHVSSLTKKAISALEGCDL